MKEFQSRNSNLELFRIIAMLLVLILHSDYLTFGRPSQEDAINSPFNSILRAGINTTSIICVNCFVLISGWFGIHPKIKRFVGFLFQVFFISIVSLCFYSHFSNHTIDIKDIKSLFLLTNDLWFVKAYIVLYLLSPALNAFKEFVTQRQYLLTIIGLFLFQTLYGWVFVSVNYINDGYSPISFILLYLLAQYIRKYPGFIKSLTAFKLTCIFISIVIVGTMIEYLFIRYNMFRQIQWSSYVYPLVVLESVVLLLVFSKLSFHNRYVNWIASSCFAVYLLHCTRNILQEYCNLVKSSFYSYHIFGIVAVVVCVFFISILLDKVRVLIWNLIAKYLFKE